MKNLILGTIGDLVSNFLYYDRKEDEELPKGKIDEAVKNGTITIDEMVEKFRKELTDNIKS